jgi:hypothetical protein
MKNFGRLLSTMALASLVATVAIPSAVMALPCADARCNNTHPAPGPIAGAGLPFLAIGYGVYWVVKRRRKAT